MKKHLIPFTILIIIFSIFIIIFSNAVPAFAQENAAQKSCLDCHKKTNAKTFIHEPSKESCKNCHLPTGKQHPNEDEEGFKLVEQVPQLCYTCHDPVNTKKHLHSPVKSGSCLDCHDVHSSKEKKLISLTLPDLCFFCHSNLEKKLDTAKSFHLVTKNGPACINCHSPHQSSQSRLLVMAEKDLCLNCHNKSITKDQRVIPNIKNELNKNKFIHSAIVKNGCSGCHDPHASDQNNLLKGYFTNNPYVSGKSKDNFSLCFQCHNPALLENKITEATGFRNGDKNLHFKHVNKAKGRSCVLCHGIHSAPNEFLLVDRVKYGNWDMPLKFSKTETGGKCITACHAPKTYSRAPSK